MKKKMFFGHATNTQQQNLANWNIQINIPQFQQTITNKQQFVSLFICSFGFRCFFFRVCVWLISRAKLLARSRVHCKFPDNLCLCSIRHILPMLRAISSSIWDSVPFFSRNSAKSTQNEIHMFHIRSNRKWRCCFPLYIIQNVWKYKHFDGFDIF